MEIKEVTPNNDFLFIEEDFIVTQTQINDALRRQSNRNTAWNTIQGLKGKAVEFNSAKDVVCEWTVMEYMFEIVQQKEEKLYATNCIILTDPEQKSNEMLCNSLFWFLWPRQLIEIWND